MPPSPRGRIAVLGAGIMGSCTALMLAEAGFEAVLFDAAPAPLCGASRWNEGRVHLGFVYAADPSLSSARAMIPGGLAFVPLLERLIGRSLAGAGGPEEDVFLVHRRSVVGPEAIGAYYQAVVGLLHEAGLASAFARPLSAGELAAMTCSEEVAAGFAVSERSVDTRWVADRLAEALAAAPRLSLRTGVRILAAAPEESEDGPWRIATDPPGAGGRFDAVVNALWHGRPAVDATAGLPDAAPFTQRYRVALFVRTAPSVSARGAVIAVGPFGDVKDYGGGRFYLSWYPSGLLVETFSDRVADPPLPDPASVIAGTRAGLAPLLPAVAAILDRAEEVSVGGGWVFALGRGSLADPASALHRRDGFGLRRRGRYISVDTGKYSTAPWLAGRIARLLAEGA
ncbi:MAG: FAD-binding oxidoreductase [Acetobacteraceae bacterium]|nr:FAD-binding oxidoreductase [Acetobacteraceae bacterium]